jgi:hypothetical protein
MNYTKLLPNVLKCAILYLHCIMENKDLKNKPEQTTVMHSFKDDKSSFSPKKAVTIFIVLIIFGLGAGYSLAKYSAKTGNSVPLLPSKSSAVKGKTYGSDDTGTFKDTAEGVLQEGGIDGEGQFHLVRPGGDSQNVYMTSSTVDLSQFVGKKIKVWGQTQTAQKAGWLMDVGRVEVL